MENDARMLTYKERISKYIAATKRLIQEEFNLDLPYLNDATEQMDQLGLALRELAEVLSQRQREREKLNQITSNINAGLFLEDILEIVYESFHDVIPYNRIGFSLIEKDGNTVRSLWAKSDQQIMLLKANYTGTLTGSSLGTIISTSCPRIIADLREYLKAKPTSASTRLILEEGMRSSLTCPLIVNGTPIGFMFFSSIEPNTYTYAHINVFEQIAGHLAVMLEKGRLVSELALQKKEIERQNEELVRLNELKNTFLGIAAHDLRGPIGNIQMITDLLLDPEIQLTGDEHKTLLYDISLQTNHMFTLLNNLLDVTRIEAGRLELEFEEFDLLTFLKQIVSRHNVMAAAKKTAILLELVPRIHVKADPVRLRQVVDNLVSNAVKYSPPGSIVRVSADKVEHGWRISVQDEGPGITLQDRTHLFQDFARLSAKPTGGEKSVGLGLAISRSIVEAHGGSIGVDSEPGHGARFWFTVPC